ncbi:PREDICTED: NAC domain-containing protein 90-like isoform X2 [Nelumbo nucifera]|uniref:NAC domain-containing protein 90-like isoform X2 n=2 Tax=Nelumbo nucifera TaxID=4432 RepID=A0A1U8AUK8_NELNU|nr:PREDICTED: NAC domain-containing protein 90-like isoform X2 [Nelumbo nucifera]DAD28880.1 TPA_asm: hypothetical protein HUJ06_030348 [Nelumbo nucifera]
MEDVPPGFRFYPTEEELVSFYLYNKLEGIGPDLERVIPIVDIYELDPWQLPQVSGELCHGDPEQWFFFSPRQEREARGGRPNRTTNSGYWKATGSPGLVYSSGNRIIGLKKTMVFYKGKAPTGTKTKWKMNEYRATQGEATSSSSAAPLELGQARHQCNKVMWIGGRRLIAIFLHLWRNSAHLILHLQAIKLMTILLSLEKVSTGR